MNVILSLATSADNKLDDCSPKRLVLSSEEDWQAVYALRASVDAILIGAGTLRADNPSLGLKKMKRQEGAVDPLRVVVTRNGELPLEHKLFSGEGSPVIVFSKIERPELAGLAEVIVSQMIDPAFIVSELEKRGVRSLMVEGGAEILGMFLSSSLVNTLRLACNPSILVGDENAPNFDASNWVEGAYSKQENLGGMQVITYTLKEHREASEHEKKLLARTLDCSRRSPSKDSCYRVGAIVETALGEIFEGYTLEGASTHHAEQVAIYKAQESGVDLRGATIYSSLEPCSMRSSEKESCSSIIIRLGFKRAVFSLYEPSHFVECHGAENMRRAGIEVLCVDDFAEEVIAINGHVLK